VVGGCDIYIRYGKIFPLETWAGYWFSLFLGRPTSQDDALWPQDRSRGQPSSAPTLPPQLPSGGPGRGPEGKNAPLNISRWGGGRGSVLFLLESQLRHLGPRGDKLSLFPQQRGVMPPTPYALPKSRFSGGKRAEVSRAQLGKRSRSCNLFQQTTGRRVA